MTTESAYPDLVSWLRAQLDADEAVARAASRPYPYADEGARAPEGGVHWRWGTGAGWETTQPDPVVSDLAADGYPVTLLTVEEWTSTSRLADGTVIHARQMPNPYGTAEEIDSAAALHIQRHDPAHVLATVSAHRAILERHRCIEQPDARPRITGLCSLCNELCPCLHVRLLAAIYSDRPGYRSEWSPG